jgi:hypothetical protein
MSRWEEEEEERRRVGDAERFADANIIKIPLILPPSPDGRE